MQVCPTANPTPFPYLTLYCLVVNKSSGPKRRTHHIFYSVQKLAVVQRKKELSLVDIFVATFRPLVKGRHSNFRPPSSPASIDSLYFWSTRPIQNLLLAFSLQKLSCGFPDVSLVYEDEKYWQWRTNMMKKYTRNTSPKFIILNRPQI